MLFVPLWDKNPIETLRFQFVTLGLVLANIVVFVCFSDTGPALLGAFSSERLASLAIIPRELLGYSAPEPASGVFPTAPITFPEGATLITYMFLHADWIHLIGNMLFLWTFGDNVEDAMGHLKFLMFYLMCGIFAGLVHVVSQSGSDVPLIGASGAVAGVIAAYLMLHPNVRVWCLVLFKIPIRLSAGVLLTAWIGLQIYNVATSAGGPTAWWAHIGGFIAGAILVLFMRRPNVPLFDKGPGI
jgi:membrane associated rhomboid family serine protease